MEPKMVDVYILISYTSGTLVKMMIPWMKVHQREHVRTPSISLSRKKISLASSCWKNPLWQTRPMRQHLFDAGAQRLVDRHPRYIHVPTQRSPPPKHGLSRTLIYSSHQTALVTPLTCDSVAPELLVVVLLAHGRYVSILG